MIIYIKLLKNSKSQIKPTLVQKFEAILKDSSSDNSNQKFIQSFLKSEKFSFHDSAQQFQADSIVLLKLLEFNFFLKYNKSVHRKYEKRNLLNHSDIIIKGLYLYEKAYDILTSSLKNFFQKSSWNFCELMKNIFEGYPKLIKATLVRHLKYVPNDDNLLYNLIQYYYLNKNKRNSKILIKKVLAKESTSAVSEIGCLILMMLINIHLANEKYGVN